MQDRHWYVWKTPPLPGSLNMAIDECCLNAADTLPGPLLRFYDWTEATATFGYFQRYAEARGLTPLPSLIRRPTGGAVVAHEADWTYSLIFPTTSHWYRYRARESYESLHQWLSNAFDLLHVPTQLASAEDTAGPGRCFVGAVQHDLLLEQRKVAGAAQRRTKEGLLIQGSVQAIPEHLSRSSWEDALQKVAEVSWQVIWKPWQPTQALRRSADQLDRSKYRTEDYNRQR